MILITQSPYQSIATWLKEAVFVLSQNDLEGFIDKFDCSALKKRDFYMILRHGNEKRKPLIIDSPYDTPLQEKIIKTQYSYLLQCNLYTYGKSNGLVLEVEFIIDKDMFYVILQDMHDEQLI